METSRRIRTFPPLGESYGTLDRCYSGVDPCPSCGIGDSGWELTFNPFSLIVREVLMLPEPEPKLKLKPRPKPEPEPDPKPKPQPEPAVYIYQYRVISHLKDLYYHCTLTNPDRNPNLLSVRSMPINGTRASTNYQLTDIFILEENGLTTKSKIAQSIQITGRCASCSLIIRS